MTSPTVAEWAAREAARAPRLTAEQCARVAHILWGQPAQPTTPAEPATPAQPATPATPTEGDHR